MRILGYAPLLAPLAPLALLLGALWGGSRSPSPLDVQRHEPQFATTDSSELFFINIRSIRYEKRDGPAEGIDLFYAKELREATVEPFLVKQWLTDRAYLMVRDAPSAPKRVLVDGDPVDLDLERPEGAFRGLMRLYAAELQGDEVTLESGAPLWENRSQASAFARLCRDYLELVDLF